MNQGRGAIMRRLLWTDVERRLCTDEETLWTDVERSLCTDEETLWTDVERTLCADAETFIDQCGENFMDR